MNAKQPSKNKYNRNEAIKEDRRKKIEENTCQKDLLKVKQTQIRKRKLDQL